MQRMEHSDIDIRKVIIGAGGMSELAHMMGFDKIKGYGRVRQWKHSGRAPDMVCLAYAKLFRKLQAKADRMAAKAARMATKEQA
jgi:hypothetical protein